MATKQFNRGHILAFHVCFTLTNFWRNVLQNNMTLELRNAKIRQTVALNKHCLVCVCTIFSWNQQLVCAVRTSQIFYTHQANMLLFLISHSCSYFCQAFSLQSWYLNLSLVALAAGMTCSQVHRTPMIFHPSVQQSQIVLPAPCTCSVFNPSVSCMYMDTCSACGDSQKKICVVC